MEIVGGEWRHQITKYLHRSQNHQIWKWNFGFKCPYMENSRRHKPPIFQLLSYYMILTNKLNNFIFENWYKLRQFFAEAEVFKNGWIWSELRSIYITMHIFRRNWVNGVNNPHNLHYYRSLDNVYTAVKLNSIIH